MWLGHLYSGMVTAGMDRNGPEIRAGFDRIADSPGMERRNWGIRAGIARFEGSLGIAFVLFLLQISLRCLEWR